MFLVLNVPVVAVRLPQDQGKDLSGVKKFPGFSGPGMVSKRVRIVSKSGKNGF